MGLFTWIKWLGRRGTNTPLSFDEWLATPPSKTAVAINRHLDREIARRGSNPPCGGGEITRAEWTTFTEGTMQRGFGNGGPVTPKPPIKPQPTGGRLIYGDRDPGPVNQSAPAPAEMPSDELMEQWREECRQLSADSNYAIPASSFMVQRVVAWARQQQAQSIQLPPLGADPVATTENLWDLWASVFWADTGAGQPDARRAVYNRGRADERAAIAKALGMQP
jgi:hypothetical protein